MRLQKFSIAQLEISFQKNISDFIHNKNVNCFTIYYLGIAKHPLHK